MLEIFLLGFLNRPESFQAISVEIKEDQPREKNRLFIQSLLQQGGSHRHLRLQRLKGGQGRGSFAAEKREGPACALIVACWLGKLEVG